MRQTSSNARGTVERMIYLSGCPRSGTTLVGNLIGSARGAEYDYEPATLHSLLSVLPDLRAAGQLDTWRLLFETYCHEELLLGNLAGRNFNLNPHDDSWVGHYRPLEEIAARQAKGWRKYELDALAAERTLVVKTPGVLPELAQVARLYPTLRLGVLLREPNDVLGSLLSRKWFDLSPYREVRGAKVPVCIPPELDRWWLDAREVERAARYLLVQMTAALGVERAVVIDYDALVRAPEAEVEPLLHAFGLVPTPKTAEVAAGIAPRPSRYPDLVGQLPEPMQREIAETTDALRSRKPD